MSGHALLDPRLEPATRVNPGKWVTEQSRHMGDRGRRLSRLSVWWIELGIRPELTQPARPEQNGSHERMHRTLKRATTRPADLYRPSPRAFPSVVPLSYTHLRAHETRHDIVCRLLLEKKKK